MSPDISSTSGEPLVSILVVCTGNICRSPIAEQLIRIRLSHLDFLADVTSAGTHASPGTPMTTQAIEVCSRLGGTPLLHRATQLDVGAIAMADLVLTATRQHRADVVSLHPRASRYTFTLKQFARLIDTAIELEPALVLGSGLSTTEAVLALSASVASSRGFAPPLADAADDDIVDPYRRDQSVYDRVGREIDDAVDTIVSALAQLSGSRGASTF